MSNRNSSGGSGASPAAVADAEPTPEPAGIVPCVIGPPLRFDGRGAFDVEPDPEAPATRAERELDELHGALQRIQAALAPKLTNKWWTAAEMEAEVMRLRDDFRAVQRELDYAKAGQPAAEFWRGARESAKSVQDGPQWMGAGISLNPEQFETLGPAQPVGVAATAKDACPDCRCKPRGLRR